MGGWGMQLWPGHAAAGGVNHETDVGRQLYTTVWRMGVLRGPKGGSGEERAWLSSFSLLSAPTFPGAHL